MREHLRRLGALYIVGGLWLLLLAAHGWLEWATATWWPTQDDVPWAWEWARASVENLQSEAWQVGLAVVVVDRAAAVRRWFRAKETV